MDARLVSTKGIYNASSSLLLQIYKAEIIAQPVARLMLCTSSIEEVAIPGKRMFAEVVL